MSKTIRVAVLASGRGTNFKSLAKNCAREDYPASIELLVTDNPEAGALEIAEEMGIDSMVVDCGPKRGSMTGESSENIARTLGERGVDLVCLAGFMRIVKGKLLRDYEGKMMNIHPALLPSFRGLDGQKQALDYGVRYTGCTVHFVDSGVDTGPIIIQRVVPVHQDDSLEDLSGRILKEEHKAYAEAVRLFAEGKLEIRDRKVIIKNNN